MFRCHACGSTESHTEYVNEVFQIEGNPVLVEKIPAAVCERCGEAIFSRETTEKVRQMVHGETTPVRTIQMNVFQFVL